MPWVRLDDAFADHQKILEAGPLAGWLWVCAIAWSNRNGTDGRIPRQKITALADFDGIGVYTGTFTGDDVDPRDLAQHLVDVGLFEPLPDGSWMIHDYTDYQLTKDEMAERRAAKSAAGKKGADARWHSTSHSTSHGTSDGGSYGTSMAQPQPQHQYPSHSISGLTQYGLDGSELVDLIARFDLETFKAGGGHVTSETGWLRTARAKAADTYGAEAVAKCETFAIDSERMLAEVLTGRRRLTVADRRAS